MAASNVNKPTNPLRESTSPAVNSEGAVPDLESFEPSRDYCRALEGDRESALVLWREIAEGQLSDEHKSWIRHVAAAVLEADRLPKNRAAAMLPALGLAGAEDRHRQVRQRASVLKAFGARNEEILADLKHQRLLDDETADARSVLDRELRKDRKG